MKKHAVAGTRQTKRLFYRCSMPVLVSVMLAHASLSMAENATSVAQAQATTTTQHEKSAAQRLNVLLKKTQRFQANFVQTTAAKKHAKPLNKPANKPKGLQVSAMNKNFSGTMMVERPRKFRWETKVPSNQLIISNNEKLWIYDPDLEQATLQRVDQEIANTPALLLSGNPQKIMSNFRVTQPNPKKQTFVLFPKQAEGVFNSLAIAFIKGVPRSMVLNDALGQVTTIKFTQVKHNVALKPSLFKFKPPEGVDVIYQ